MELTPPELSSVQRGAWLVGMAGALVLLFAQLAGAARLLSRDTAGLISMLASLCAALVCGLTWAATGRSFGSSRPLLWLASFAWAFAGIALVALLSGGWWALLYIPAAAPMVAYAMGVARWGPASATTPRSPVQHRYRKRR